VKKNSSWLIALLVPACTAWGVPTRTPEEEARWLLPKLKPVEDSEWSKMMGPSVSQTVQVVPGDTLSGISQRLFGNPKYWPKIWSQNNGALLNPHVINPGDRIQLSSGSGADAPQVFIAENSIGNQKNSVSSSSVPVSDVSPTGVSQEWRKLPRQPWELSLGLGSEISVQGIDSQSRLRFRSSTGSDLPFRVLSGAVQELGVVTGGREKHNAFMLGDVVFIRPGDTESLHVGKIYSLVGPNIAMKFTPSLRTGELLEVLGKVKIIGVKDGVFVGEISQHSSEIIRGVRLIPLINRVPDLSPVAGPSEVEATVQTEFGMSTDVTAQNKLVALDRGVDDGVREGMVFRFYQRKDPSTGKQLTQSDFVISGEAMVVQVSEQISLARVVRSFGSIDNGARAVLLTDVSDLSKRNQRSIKELGQGSTAVPAVDQVDQLDVSGGLGNDESKELRQLERWNEDENAPTAPEPSELDSTEAPPLEQPVDAQPTAPVEAAPVTPPQTLPPPPPSAETLNPSSQPDLSPPDELPPATEGELNELDELLNQ
jgi:hypothetical protein